VITQLPTPGFSFELLATLGHSRAGVLHTPRGDILTPVFMPVGTLGTVKAMTVAELEAPPLDARIILGNTYHLYLRPGLDVIGAHGGLHAFSAWRRPILTDSGGFQVMSLSGLRKVDERAVTFRSHLDGAMVELTPERAIEIQMLLGADIAMQLDECLKLPAKHDEISRAMQLSLRWAERSKRAFEENARDGHALFGIVQGGDDLTLREESARALTAMGFHGYAIGGLAVGEPQDVMLRIVAATAPMLPADRPRYLMGVGTPHDLIEAVARGIDMFDCVLPTRNARNGQLFTSLGRINIKNARYAEDDGPVDPACRCYTCTHHSRAYLRHLHLAGEMSGGALNTLHNLAFYLDTMRRIREAITFGTFDSFRQEFLRSVSRLPVDS
jgi:queuine tRNA-ribosyltransferase